MRIGPKLSFADCMRTEFRIVSRIVYGHDFYEGVRAVIVDKDQKPDWRPATLREWVWLLGAVGWSALWLQQAGGLGAQFARSAAVLVSGSFLALTLWRPSNGVCRALTATAGAAPASMSVEADERLHAGTAPRRTVSATDAARFWLVISLPPLIGVVSLVVCLIASHRGHGDVLHRGAGR